MLQVEVGKNTEKTRSLSLGLVIAQDVNILSNLAEATFRETYELFNTPKNMVQYVQEHFSKQALLADIQHPLINYFLAYYENKPAGYCMLDKRRTVAKAGENDTIEISRIYVLKKYQGKKIGKFLMNACVRFAMENNCKTIWLGVWEKNENAIQFYLHEGFILAGTTTFTLGDDPQEDHIMIKNLSD
jgi:GNAT superfamily N-acetyltransferase